MSAEPTPLFDPRAAEPGAHDGYTGGLRKVARVVLLDPQDRILLLHGHEPDDPSDDWWFTPGGGVEGDETREQAALRELAEETGITDVELGSVLWKRRCSFPFAGRRWDQDEWYYLARTTGTGRATAALGLTELEKAVSPVHGGGRAENWPRRMRRCIRRDSPSCSACCSTKVPRPAPQSWTQKSSRGARDWRTMVGSHG